MKRCTNILFAILMLLSGIFTFSPVNAAKKTEASRAIGIVFDNSGSMYVDGEQAWCRATYAMEVFASMLNKGDTLQIYPMHPITVNGKEYTMKKPFTITDASQASSIRSIYTKEALGTPIESVDEAVKGVKKLKEDKKYVIVLTDGDVFYKGGSMLSADVTRQELDDRFKKNAGKDLTMMYLGIGQNVVMPDTKESSYFFKKQAANSADTLSSLTEMCNLIFGRDTLPKSYLSDKQMKLDISISKLIVFVQGENVSDLTVTGSNGEVGKLESKTSTKYGSDGCGNYKAVSDKTLQGMMVTYTDCPAGTYTINYKGKATSVEVYYEPDADLDFIFTDAEGNLVDPNSLYEGDYKVAFGMKDAKTGQLINSELLGTPHYAGTYSINGTEQKFAQDGNSGEVPVSLKMNDAFDANLTVTYLSGYTIKKDSSDFGWPKGGIKVAARPAGDLKLKISGGDEVYSLQDLEKGKPYIAEIYYKGEKLTGKELERVELKWNPETSFAEIKKNPVEDHYDLSLHYKDPKAPAQTVCGECKVVISAHYAAQGSDEAKAQATVTYTIEDDAIPVSGELSAPQDYIVISDLADSEALVFKVTMDGKNLTAEDFKAVSLQVDCGGINYTVTPNEKDSSFLIQLMPTDGIDEGDYPIKVTAKYLDHIGRETIIEDNTEVELSNTPLWIKWLIILLILLALLFIIWRILRLKVLPKRIQVRKRDSRFIFDGENETNATHFCSELNGKQLRVYNKYDGSKLGISMDVKPGKESYLSKSQTKRYAEVLNGVRKYGGETITEVSVGTVRFVLNEETGKLERTPQGKSAINLKHGMPIRYSGRMASGGTTKTFSVNTKLNFKKK